MKKTKAQLLADIERLSHDPIWRCYTRQALELRWTEFTDHAVGIVYLDIDKMHDLNDKYGHAGTDSRISFVVESIRHGDIVASRWLNGDELVFILCSGDTESFCKRIQASFAEVGISVTICYSRIITSNSFETLNPCDEQVTQYKRVGLRGEIIPLQVRQK